VVKRTIDSGRLYTAREAADLLEVIEDTVKRYCRNGDLKCRQIGPRKKWHVLGREISRVRKEWGYAD
jgi:predicted site-specific integrase-resolvase